MTTITVSAATALAMKVLLFVFGVLSLKLALQCFTSLGFRVKLFSTWQMSAAEP